MVLHMGHIWDPENSIHRARMQYLITCISEGMKRGLATSVNCDKVKEVTQEKDENPAEFLNPLSRAF
jgi:hypothetical protein